MFSPCLTSVTSPHANLPLFIANHLLPLIRTGFLPSDPLYACTNVNRARTTQVGRRDSQRRSVASVCRGIDGGKCHPPFQIRHVNYHNNWNADWEPQDATFPIPFQSRLHFKPSPPVKSLYQKWSVWRLTYKKIMVLSFLQIITTGAEK